MALAGRIPIKINHVPAITARDVSIKKSRKQEVHVGAYGRIGRSQGQACYSAMITFSTPEDKAEFIELSEAGMADDAEGFTLTYEKGGETYLLTDCGIAENKAKIVASLDGSNQVISDFFAGGTAVALGAQKVLNYLG